jgi:hypothetical protein
MTLKVIGAGLGRTGTMTLKRALDALGFGPCHHMTEVLAHPEQIPFWNRAADGEAVDWDEVYRAYQSTVDWPGAAFTLELAQRYPEAKVILSKRDPQGWYESMRDTILKSMDEMHLTDVELAKNHPMRFGQILIAHDLFACNFSEANVLAAFERHNAKITAAIPADRLLVFEAADGWNPLCQFLGVEVPDEIFPRTNTRDEYWTHADKAREISAELRTE